MEIMYSSYPEDIRRKTTKEMRDRFLIKDLFKDDNINMNYCYDDRMIVGGAKPIIKKLELKANNKSSYFLERREMGIINIGGKGLVEADDIKYLIDNKEGMYIGKGVKNISFSSINKDNPPKFYFLSSIAHISLPVKKIDKSNITEVSLGSKEKANKRTLFKYIHPDGVKSCQLVMGLTSLDEGSVWNTMPAHTHDRRMEVYLYTKIPKEEFVMHIMGEREETRHLIVRNNEAVISPAWSIHSGVGTLSYTFIWGMGGENQKFDDMDVIPMSKLL